MNPGDELVDVVDEADQVTGQVSRAEMRSRNLRHRAAYVLVFNDRGQCLAGVRLDAGLKRGVAQMSTGAWYDPLVPGEIGTLDKSGNPNVLTIDKGSSSLTQGASAHTCLIEVERFVGELPPITAYDPPTFVRRTD